MGRRRPDNERPGGWADTRLLLLGAAVAASLITWTLAAGNRLSPPGVAIWLASVVLWVTALGEPGPSRSSGAPRRTRVPWRRTLLILFAILALAAFFRFYRLAEIPPEMTSDHVEKLLDVHDVLDGARPVFFPRNAGREPIQMYLVAIFAALFGTGISFMSLKLVSAMEGLLLIPAVALLGRELVDRTTGWIAGALVAVSWWHTTLSRLGLRIVLTPLIAALLVRSLHRALRTGERRDFLTAGVWLGLGFYAYQALRIAPLLAVACVGLVLLDRDAGQGEKRRRITGLLVAAWVALMVALPMVRFSIEQPGAFWGRALNRLTSAESTIDGHPLGVLAANLGDSLLMFHFRGDASWFTSVPHAPLLDPLTGLLFLVGLSAWLLRLARRRTSRDALVLCGLLVFLLPSALALAFPIESPSASRASGVIPLVFVLAACPVSLLLRAAPRPSIHRFKAPLLILGAGLFLVIATLNYRTYFHRYAESYRSRALNPSEVGAVVAGFAESEGSLDHVYLQGVPHWHDHRAVAIEAGDLGWSNAILDVAHLRHLLSEDERLRDGQAKMFIVHPADNRANAVLRTAYPRGRFTLIESTLPDRDFRTFVVPARARQ